MAFKGLERRACIRFEIPGATIRYKLKKLFFEKQVFEEEFCPLIEMSRGGLQFLAQNTHKVGTSVSLEISIPGERVPLVLAGRIRWTAPNVGKSYKYRMGVQFSPYGEKKGQNYPGILVKIISLEQKYCPTEPSEKEKSTLDEFETDD
jgi:Tfp pilus assembly protein PilZ